MLLLHRQRCPRAAHAPLLTPAACPRTAAAQGQQRRIAELEARLAEVLARLQAAEARAAAAEERVAALGGEVESSASVFRLHYDELLRKDREIQELQVGAPVGRALAARQRSAAGSAVQAAGAGGVASGRGWWPRSSSEVEAENEASRAWPPAPLDPLFPQAVISALSLGGSAGGGGASGRSGGGSDGEGG